MSDNSPQKGEAEGYVIGTPFYTLAHWQHSCQRQADTIREQDAEIVRLRRALEFYAKPWHRTVLRETKPNTHYTLGVHCGYVRIDATEGRALAPDDPLLVQHRVARKALGLSEYFQPDEMQEALQK